MSSLPTPLRAALGIALTAVDTARDTVTHLPQKAAGLPVAVASQAVQLSLRAQQQWAAYVNKGDELIGAFRGTPEEPPAWATFDEDEPTPARNTAFDRVPDAEDELDELQALDDLEGVADAIGDPALDLLDGSYEGTDGPKPTPGAPDTVTDADVVRDAQGDETIAADAPRTTAPREPARKATRKVATKASRKTTTPTRAPAKKAAKKAAAPKASPAAAAPDDLAATTLEGGALVEEPFLLPDSPDAQVSDTQPDDEREA